MQHQTVPQASPSKLLADPEQVALAREVIAYARKIGAQHAIYSIGDGTGRSCWPREHVWTLNGLWVSYEDGRLAVRRDQASVLKATVPSTTTAVDLLAAIDILPARFARAYHAGVNDGRAFAAAARGGHR